jgi:RimJ/RimL family protein N-acetyltransferase
MAMDVVAIETDRLRLRGHRLDDFRDSFAMWSDPLVTRHIGGAPSTEQQSWMRLIGYVGHWSLLQFGYWVVEERAGRQFVGEVGFADFRRDVDPSLDDAPEIGWVFATAFHGRGYATEAARAAVAWGDRHFASPRTVCLIDADNAASIRVAEKAGYTAFKRIELKGTPTMLFERLRPD